MDDSVSLPVIKKAKLDLSPGQLEVSSSDVVMVKDPGTNRGECVEATADCTDDSMTHENDCFSKTSMINEGAAVASKKNEKAELHVTSLAKSNVETSTEVVAYNKHDTMVTDTGSAEDVLLEKFDAEKSRSEVLQGATEEGKADKDRERNEEFTCQAEAKVMEKDVGIEEYISKLSGFQAVIKQRYSDFLVNEISQDGSVIHLTSTDLPCSVPDSLQAGGNIESITTGVISDEDADKLKKLLESKDKNTSVLIKVGEDKAMRAKIHNVIEKRFPGLDSNTITQGGNKYIEVKITSNKGNGLQRWPKGRGFYCKFVMYKEGKDTMDAIGLIANKLRLKSSLFQYAGTKDKRAKTSQEVTVFKVAAEKLQEANHKLRNIVTGNYSYTSEKLTLGQLQGNKFTVVLRSVTGTEERIVDGMMSLRDVGFINYYGMQRFGVTSVPTHHIGRALLCGNWKEAVEMILKPRPGEEQFISEAREFWWRSRDSKGALSKFPKHCYIERNILQGLIDRGDNDYMAAINRVARNTRLMYVHAYQSYVWNNVVSHRMRRHGMQLVCGDLVVPRNSSDFLEETDTEQASINRTKVTPVMTDSSNIGSHTIYDVVLPKPGYDVKYPGCDIESIYKELMEKDGIDYLSMKTKYRDYSLSGDYRYMIVKPADVSWKLLRYNDVNVPLALSDWDKMINKFEPQNVEDGASLAVRVEFTLPSSCYATMALREVLKIDTSSAYQATLNTVPSDIAKTFTV